MGRELLATGQEILGRMRHTIDQAKITSNRTRATIDRIRITRIGTRLHEAFRDQTRKAVE